MHRLIMSLTIAALVAKTAFAVVRYIMAGRSIMWLVVSAVCFFLLMATFISHEARSQECMTLENRLESLDKHTKKEKVGAKAYRWVYPDDPAFSFVYVLFNNSSDVVLVMFQNDCVIPNPLTGTWATKMPMNEKVEANIANSDLVFEANAPISESY